MNRTLYRAVLTATTATCNAVAIGDIAEVTIIDRDSGATCAIAIHNSPSRPITSLDGASGTPK
jgi:hypothetical protein